MPAGVPGGVVPNDRLRTFQRCRDRDLDQRFLDVLVVTALKRARDQRVYLQQTVMVSATFSPTVPAGTDGAVSAQVGEPKILCCAMVALHGKLDGAGWHE